MLGQPLTVAGLGFPCERHFLREIDEELRRDNLLKLWQRYGRYVIGVVIAALLIAGGDPSLLGAAINCRSGRRNPVRYEAELALLRQSKAAKGFRLGRRRERRLCSACVVRSGGFGGQIG